MYIYIWLIRPCNISQERDTRLNMASSLKSYRQVLCSDSTLLSKKGEGEPTIKPLNHCLTPHPAPSPRIKSGTKSNHVTSSPNPSPLNYVRESKTVQQSQLLMGC